MLSLQLRTGDYMTIGDKVVVQLNHITGDRCKLMVEAPKDMTILRARSWNGLAGSGPSAFLTARTATGRKFSGIETSRRHWPL